jgi:hypothetical protein
MEERAGERRCLAHTSWRHKKVMSWPGNVIAFQAKAIVFLEKAFGCPGETIAFSAETIGSLAGAIVFSNHTIGFGKKTIVKSKNTIRFSEKAIDFWENTIVFLEKSIVFLFRTTLCVTRAFTSTATTQDTLSRTHRTRALEAVRAAEISPKWFWEKFPKAGAALSHRWSLRLARL